MTSFKYKPPKIKFLNKIDTLDGIHKTYKVSFDKNRNELIKKKTLLVELRNEYNRTEKTKLNVSDIKKRSQIKCDIESLENDIHNIENNLLEMDYYGKTGKILMDYYEIIGRMLSSNQDSDEKETIIKNETNISQELENLNKLSQQRRKLKKPTKKRLKYNNNIQKKSIIDFFKEQENDNLNETASVSSDEHIYETYDDLILDDNINNNNTNNHKMVDIVKNKNDNIDEIINENSNIIVNNRAELFDKYLNLINKNDKIVIHNQSYICEKCKVDRIINQSEGSIVCPLCGETSYIIIECETTNFKDPVIEKPAYPYKRANHLSEWLSSFQAKETTDIPKDVYNMIISELQKNRITNPKHITLRKMKGILKKLRLHQYYEHTPHIISKITGQPAPTINREMEEKIKSMFNDIQVPFSLFCPPSRINFLSYSYTLHKICQLLELDDFTHCFPLLKSRDKLRIQDSIWKKICKYNSWDFIPSV